MKLVEAYKILSECSCVMLSQLPGKIIPSLSLYPLVGIGDNEFMYLQWQEKNGQANHLHSWKFSEEDNSKVEVYQGSSLALYDTEGVSVVLTPLFTKQL